MRQARGEREPVREVIYVPPWLELARADARLGVMEIPGPEHHPRIIEYHSYCTLHATADEVHWCSAALCCWIEESRLALESTRSAAARSWLDWGRPISTPLFGCIVVLKRGGLNQPGPEVKKAPGHVGIFIDLPAAGEVLMYGANQSDKVCERTFPAERVLSYRVAG